MSQKAVYIENQYLELTDQASFPPEISTRRARINHLVRLGLMRLGALQSDDQAGRSVPGNVGSANENIGLTG